MNKDVRSIGLMMQPPAVVLELAQEMIRQGEIGAGLCGSVYTIPRPMVGPNPLRGE